MTDSARGEKACELLAQASRHPVASPQRNALVAEAAVWAQLEYAATMDEHAAVVVDIESALASLADSVQQLRSEVGGLTGRMKLSQK
ncbi:hypothetical protein OG930_03200 [Streptomyces sp. NBC_01799]|uniref:hypothetical protein n=1 Tax=Streptomyces sp. NBC_01800 TaxID=2975945 RepID=UPI002DDC2B64|nr:hypothetical protein [Streptomyces sp. NBC_01800]WSA66098.1 hypothetical protein OIE65_03280 [Streptomyces sp. NBC_01800]WSA74700.1 hypothetical protein OG930_03200 [Streptomyces sp. NBC_01799]